MRQRILLLVATAVLLVGIGVSALPQSEAQNLPTSTLSGMVCITEPEADGRSMPPYEPGCQGLPGATVRLTRPGVSGPVGAVDSTVKADADGAFRFERLADGKDYRLEASHANFATSTVTVEVKGDTKQDAQLVGQVFRQAGKVVGPQERPIAGAMVTACCSFYDAREAPKPARTAADGSFSVEIRAGYRSISVSEAPGYQELHDYRLLVGTPLTLELKPTPPPDAFIRGTVRDQDGNPVAGIRIDASGHCCVRPMPASDGGASTTAMSPGYYGGGNTTRTDSSGNYRIGVYAGEVSLNANGGPDPDEAFASKHTVVEVAKGETAEKDIRLMRYPPKTAHIKGQVTDGDGNGLSFVTINVRSPEYGLHECSTNPHGHGGLSYAEPVAMDAPASMPVWEGPECAITIDADGRFSGTVTPGYTIVEVYYQSWQACPDMGTSCGPDYYPWARTMRLAADSTTTLDIALIQRPGPDATVSGYVLDESTGKAIPGATLVFSNLDNGAYGQARTDEDGSFKVRVRSGHHMVSVSVHSEDGTPGGYLTWQGNLQVPEGDNDFDVRLAPGEEAYGGGCCWHMYDKATPMAAAEGGSGSGMSPSTPPGEEASAQEFEDLGGGLGPYDASKRTNLLEAEGDDVRTSPSVELLAVAAALGAAAVARRRR